MNVPGIRLAASMVLLTAAADAPELPSVSAKELLRRCEASATAPDVGWCEGYISAVSDLLQEGIAFAIGPVRFCPNGASVTPQSLRGIVVQYLESNTAVRDASASLAVSLALVDAFPCKVEQ